MKTTITLIQTPKTIINRAVTGQASPNSLLHAELVSASHDLAIPKQVQDDDSTIIELDLLHRAPLKTNFSN